MKRGWIAFALVPAVAVASTVACGKSHERTATGASSPGGKIAFMRTAQIFVMNADGSDQHRLTSGPAFSFEYAWSPDARRLVFVHRLRPFRDEIYVVNADGTGLRRLAHGSVRGSGPAWSPDGRRIAFVSPGIVHGKDRDRLYLINADGTGKRRLDRLPAYNHAGSPAWSPDSRRIAFTGGGAVFVINADGSGQRRLTRRGGYYFPAWSPDGSRIAFSHWHSIYVVDADGGRERLLTTHAYFEPGFAWRPDGRALIYARRHGGAVYSINVDGSGGHRLTRNGARDDLLGGFSWSPDGHTIAYETDVTGHGDIYLMNPDGSGQRRLTDSPEVEGAPVWSPKRR
jgi:TolB protein